MSVFSSHLDNEEEEDFLDVDTALPGQNFCCLSFLSPEKVLERKEVFVMKKFLDFLNLHTEENVQSKFDDFLFTHEESLTKEFTEQNNGQSSCRGLKVRGVYDSLKEAQNRAKLLQRMDRNFNVYVGQVGYWLPWDPNPDHVQESEYLEGELNKLMKGYKNNQAERDFFYAEQVQTYKNTKASSSEEVKEEVKEDGVEESKTPSF